MLTRFPENFCTRHYTCKLWPKTPSEYNYHIQTQAQTKPSHKKKTKQVANLKFTTHCDKNYCHSVNILLLHVQQNLHC